MNKKIKKKRTVRGEIKLEGKKKVVFGLYPLRVPPAIRKGGKLRRGGKERGGEGRERER